MNRLTRWTIAVAAAAVTLAGCSGSAPETTQAYDRGNVNRGVRRMFPAVDRTVVESHLKNVGIAYQNCCVSGRPPTRVEELEPFYERNKDLSDALRKGDYVVYWGVNPSDQNGNTILAYQKEPDPSGKRVVLLCSYALQVMTEPEFEQAPKAGK